MSGDSASDLGGHRNLELLGLGSLATRVYLELVMNPVAEPSSLPDLLPHPRRDIERALKQLEALGLVVASAEHGRLRVVSPQLALSRLVEQRELSLRLAQSNAALARAAAENLINEVAEMQEQRRASLEVVGGRDRASDRVAELVREAEREVLTMITSLPTPEALTQSRERDLALLDRGVHARMLVLAGHLRRSRDFVEHLQVLAEHGAQVRVATVLPTRMVVVDGAVAALPADPEDPTQGAMVLRQPALVMLAAEAFEHAWGDAAAADELAIVTPQNQAALEPNAVELQVIRLLGEGHKDEAVGRRMGMSLRSVRRVIATLSEQVGTESRFELGARCQARGWLGSDPPAPQSEPDQER